MRFLSVLSCLFLCASVSWSDPISLKKIDFNHARVSQSGPYSLYIRSVEAEGEKFSFYADMDPETGGWRVGKILPEAKNALPDDLILDFATLKAVNERDLELGGILYRGTVYKGRVGLDGTNGISLVQDVESAPLSESSLPRAVVLKELLRPYEEQIAGLTAKNAALGEELRKAREGSDSDSVRVKALEKRNSELGNEVGSLKARVAELAAKNEELKFQAEALKAEKEKTGSAKVWLEPAENRPPKDAPAVPAPAKRAVETRVSDLESKVAGLEKEIASLRGRMETAAVSGFSRGEYSRILLMGFKGASPRLGSWKVSSDSAEQTDASQHFAKLTLPVKQENRPILYSFKTKSSGRNWVGVGLHIFVDEVRKSKGYGEGKSLLVWLTRDPVFYKNGASHLQVYRSDDDVNMERVLDATIAESLDSYVDVDVLYDPVGESISLFVGGKEKVRYKTFFGVGSGVSVALRTLGGGASFKDLRVSTLP